MIAPTFLQVSSTTGCTLADLTVSGYEKQAWNDDDEDYAGGVTGGSFVLMFLSATGTAEARYYWIEQEAEKGIVAGWYADANGGAINGGAASVAIPAGQALWIIGKGLDLVMIAPKAQPPVCKIIDFGKYCYEQAKKEKEAKKNQNILLWL